MKLLAIICLLLPVYSLVAQNAALDVAFYDLPEKIKEHKKYVLSIEIILKDADFKWAIPAEIGSGFILEKENKRYIITTTHTVRKATNKHHLLIRLNGKQDSGHYYASILWSDDKNDVSILSLGSRFIFGKTANIATDLNTYETTKNIPFSLDSLDIQEGAGIFLIGFPFDVGIDRRNDFLISRVGIIASPPLKQGFFLIDITSTPDLSGSPIFNVQTGLLMGMVVGYWYNPVSTYDAQGRIMARLPYNTGITPCISAKEIWKSLP